MHGLEQRQSLYNFCRNGKIISLYEVFREFSFKKGWKIYEKSMIEQKHRILQIQRI